jgi:hypothetical protein
LPPGNTGNDTANVLADFFGSAEEARGWVEAVDRHVQTTRAFQEDGEEGEEGWEEDAEEEKREHDAAFDDSDDDVADRVAAADAASNDSNASFAQTEDGFDV